MQAINPILATAVVNEITADRRAAADRAMARRGAGNDHFGGLRRRIAARRGRSPVAVPSPRVPVRAGRA
jgi:hypothetical protein